MEPALSDSIPPVHASRALARTGGRDAHPRGGEPVRSDRPARRGSRRACSEGESKGNVIPNHHF